ncbi:BlaI/MecI/CopY family transcriptional regulator [Streptomyces sp. M2CJ-2]|uniref:BlaI/MecI/CopY family transcriptional regulator n=1 Tax=Streptomyces sp. M2CJ-2 TaxID=2803948 RepID=UPI0019259DEF|nr:BlaI/MecI/CopY family transcriptional regulator [Streptomyces sp. M2CJ-2]MBL3670769.1 BlaI/MecI/CopY family transcriptional regulator [Streptomyces sp. M2CJ-2]
MATEPEEPTTQSLRSQYAAQFAGHLADNREEQARLRKRLEQLEADEAWLVKALETVSAPAEADAGARAPEGEPAPPQDNTSGPTEPAEAAEPSEATDVEASAAVPKQRQDQPAEAPAKKTTAKKTAAKRSTAKKAAVKETTAKKATAKKPEAKKSAAKQTPAAKKTAAKTGEPALGELLLSVLGQHAGQPRTAGEVTGDLEREYPERARDINTVRNTLERLVAKSRIERTKQKNTVLYTAVTESAPAADDAAAEASPAAETAGAAATAKVPAQA